MKSKSQGEGKSEQRDFQAHSSVVLHLIKSQAGTLSKALVELVQNSLDAGAKTVTIDINDSGFVVSDDGRGFTSEEEIKRNFEVFGQPPSAEENRTIGFFRVGRGQVMGFAKTIWKSGKFRMEVDIKKHIGYTLETLKTTTPGCQISGELYADENNLKGMPMGIWRRQLMDDLRQAVAFCPISVIVNGAQYSHKSGDIKWDFEDETMYYKHELAGGLKLYNLGIFVAEFSPSYFGISGIAVSKSAMRLNMARNMPLENTCTIWAHMGQQLHKLGYEYGSKAANMSDGMRQNMINRFISGDLPYSAVCNMPLVKPANGPRVSLHRFMCTRKIIVDEPDERSQLCDALDRNTYFVLSRHTRDEFESSNAEDLHMQVCAEGEGWLDDLNLYIQDLENDTQGENEQKIKFLRRDIYAEESLLEQIGQPHFAEFDDVVQGLSVETREINNEFWSPSMTYAHKLLNAGSRAMAKAINGSGDRHMRPRIIKFGISDHADAWTNGLTTIWVNKAKVGLAKKGIPGMTELALLLLHEYTHTSEDTGTHLHDHTFLDTFHESALQTKSRPVQSAVKAMYTVMSKLRNDGVYQPTNSERYFSLHPLTTYQTDILTSISANTQDVGGAVLQASMMALAAEQIKPGKWHSNIKIKRYDSYSYHEFFGYLIRTFNLQDTYPQFMPKYRYYWTPGYTFNANAPNQFERIPPDWEALAKLESILENIFGKTDTNAIKQIFWPQKQPTTPGFNDDDPMGKCAVINLLHDLAESGKIPVIKMKTTVTIDYGSHAMQHLWRFTKPGTGLEDPMASPVLINVNEPSVYIKSNSTYTNSEALMNSAKVLKKINGYIKDKHIEKRHAALLALCDDREQNGLLHAEISPQSFK